MSPVTTEGSRGPLPESSLTADRPGDSPTRADTLLDATNTFLAASDLAALGRSVVDVSRTIFEPWKILVTLARHDGRLRIAAAAGYDEPELARLQDALDAPSELAQRAMAGEEFWSDEPGAADIRARIGTFGGVSSFGVPIVAGGRVVGSIGALYRDARTFTSQIRDQARALAGQVGLVHELISTRDELRESAEALVRKTRATEALYQVGQRLATLTAPEDVPDALARGIRSATGASFSLVGCWRPDEGRVEFVATDGLTAAQSQLLAGIDARPERYRMIRGGLEGGSDVRLPPFDPDDVPLEVVDALDVTAIAGAPVIVDGEPWGVVAVATRPGDPNIVETGADLLAGLASIAASALGRTAATAALERQAEILESMVDERTLQLREAVEEAVRASRSKSEFVASVSHELRTPLTAILGYSQLLVDGEDRLASAEQIADVEGIQRAGRQLLELINDLLDVAAIEAGGIELQPEPVVLPPFISTVVESVRPLAGQKGVALGLTIEEGLPERIEADPGRLREVLVNLVGNAVKFTPTGGTVRVVAGPGEGDMVRIEITDTGIGIAAEQRDLVFERFARVAGPAYSGTGLGLPIARELARLHGGDVELESTLGLGSTFTLRLPIRPAAGDGQ